MADSGDSNYKEFHILAEDLENGDKGEALYFLEESRYE